MGSFKLTYIQVYRTILWFWLLMIIDECMTKDEKIQIEID